MKRNPKRQSKQWTNPDKVLRKSKRLNAKGPKLPQKFICTSTQYGLIEMNCTEFINFLSVFSSFQATELTKDKITYCLYFISLREKA